MASQNLIFFETFFNQYFFLTFPYILPSWFGVLLLLLFLFTEVTLECFRFTKSLRMQDAHIKILLEICVNFHFKVNGIQNEDVEIIPVSINI